MFRGVNNVGIGVSDMDRSLKFYRDLGFKEVMFDYTGILPGMEKVIGKPDTKARVVMLKNQNTVPLGLGMIKLVYLLPPNKAKPCPVGTSRLFGDVGILEACINTGMPTEDVIAALSRKGTKPLLPLGTAILPPYNIAVNYAYVKDPDGGFIEFINWESCRVPGEGSRIEGINHVALGVSNIDNTMRFYQELGFTELIMDYSGPLDTHACLYSSNESPDFDIKLLANYRGAILEPLQLKSPYKPTPFNVSWGHLGPMEFAIGVNNLEKAYKELRNKGVEFLSPPQTVEGTWGQWKYAYLVEPDYLHVSLVEPRY